MLESLKRQVCQANKDLARLGLVRLTIGNVSGRDPKKGLVAIKPSGVEYDTLTPAQIVVVDANANVVEGSLKPSSDTPIHLELYRAFPQLGGIAHTHSGAATQFAQALRPIPCLGTTHADFFHGEVPITRPMTPEEVAGDFEVNIGRVIVECFRGRNPLSVPAVLVASHGSFTWGDTPARAVVNSVALEEIARTALGTLALNPHTQPIPGFLLDRHFNRMHGPRACYGQPQEEGRAG